MPEPSPKSTRPPKSAVAEIFRESFLVVFERTEDETAFRHVAGILHDVLCEGRSAIAAGVDIWQQSIRGAIGDFRQGVDQLADAARDLDEAGSGGRETVRIVLAIADALVVQPLADQLDAALAAYLAAGRSA